MESAEINPERMKDVVYAFISNQYLGDMSITHARVWRWGHMICWLLCIALLIAILVLVILIYTDTNGGDNPPFPPVPSPCWENGNYEDDEVD